jgi:REP element-mobilizing transposase RayT
MARGDRREEIFRDDGDRWKFLGYLAEGAKRSRVKVDCYVLMENHFHLVVMTPEGNLSQRITQRRAVRYPMSASRATAFKGLFSSR